MSLLTVFPSSSASAARSVYGPGDNEGDHSSALERPRKGEPVAAPTARAWAVGVEALLP